jgi:hypothetical protein
MAPGISSMSTASVHMAPGPDPANRLDVAAAHPDVIADITQEVERHLATIVPVKSQFKETIDGR